VAEEHTAIVEGESVGEMSRRRGLFTFHTVEREGGREKEGRKRETERGRGREGGRERKRERGRDIVSE
jgi:hypothetical protein